MRFSFRSGLIVLVLMQVATAVFAQGAGTGAGTAVSPVKLQACTLVSAAEIGQVTGRSDIASPPVGVLPPDESGMSSCSFPGKLEQLSLTVEPGTTVEAFQEMRTRLIRGGRPVEELSGIGDEAYFVNDRDRQYAVNVRIGHTSMMVSANRTPGETVASIRAILEPIARTAAARVPR